MKKLIALLLVMLMMLSAASAETLSGGWTASDDPTVTEELKAGQNSLEITVVNSWYNRVAGDEINPEGKTYTSTNIVLGHDYRGRMTDSIPLESSGLLGPVEILRGE